MLATGEVRPVGLNGSYSVDVRVIATSSRPLPDDFHRRPRRADRWNDRHSCRRFATAAATFPALARHLLSRVAEQTGLKAAVDRQ